MADYMLLMHNDAESAETDAAWDVYLHKLRATGQFEGGSAIGAGHCFVKRGRPVGVTRHLSGYLRVRAESLQAAATLLEGNPVFEGGGTVEIRELPRQ